MSTDLCSFIDQLENEGQLSEEEYSRLIAGYTPKIAAYAAAKAVAVRKKIYGNRVYVRGLIEISHFYKNY